MPTEESVAAILDAIRPLFPTPHSITFDWHFAIFITASTNDLFIFFFYFCSAFISRLSTFFAVSNIFLLFINVTRYRL